MHCVQCDGDAVTVSPVCGDAICEEHRRPNERERVGGMLFRSAPSTKRIAGISFTGRPGLERAGGLNYRSDGQPDSRGGMTLGRTCGHRSARYPGQVAARKPQ